MEANSTIYGPVRSWRLGASLGVDLLLVNSICSFRCVYCQLGKINVHTMARRVYASTEQVLEDLSRSRWREAAVITLSGSGEPTLAANLGEVIHSLKSYTGKPVAVLTNATTLNDPSVRRDLCLADHVFCKLDATDERTFRAMNRPVAGVTLAGCVEGIKTFRREYVGHLAVQIMLMRLNVGKAEAFARILNEIRPDEVQLNAPTRPIPREWHSLARGNDAAQPFASVRPKVVEADEVARMEERLRLLTGLKVLSAYEKMNAGKLHTER